MSSLRQEGQHVIHTKEKLGDEREVARGMKSNKDWKTCFFIVINLDYNNKKADSLEVVKAKQVYTGVYGEMGKTLNRT